MAVVSGQAAVVNEQVVVASEQAVAVSKPEVVAVANGLVEVGKIRVAVESRQAGEVANRLVVVESAPVVEESRQAVAVSEPGAVENGLVVVVEESLQELVEERKLPEEVDCVGSSPETDRKDHPVVVTLSVVVVCEPVELELATVFQQPELEPEMAREQAMACEPAMVLME